MWEVPHNLAKQWIKHDTHTLFAPRRIDVECPNPECRRSLVNIQLTWKPVAGFLTAHHGCAGCGNVTRFFIIDPPKDNGTEAIRSARLYQFPKPAMQASLEPGIVDVSPAFVEIHTQAQEAEALGLSSLVGIGYRKALEYLIKDYLIRKNPGSCAQISGMQLAQCIKNFVTDPNVKSCAERAAWLGNDETHYVRKWPDRDLEDLKVLLKLTRYWISSELLTAQYGVDMTHPGKSGDAQQ